MDERKRSFREALESGVDGRPLGNAPPSGETRRRKDRQEQARQDAEKPVDPAGVRLQKLGIAVHVVAILSAALLPWTVSRGFTNFTWSLFGIFDAGGFGGTIMSVFLIILPFVAGVLAHMADRPRFALAGPVGMILSVLYAGSLTNGIMGLSHGFGFYFYLILIAASGCLAFRRRSNRKMRFKSMRRR